MDGFITLNDSLICMVHRRSGFRSIGIFNGGNPFHHVGLLFLAQLSIPAFLSALLQHFLSPFGTTAFVSQMIVGIALGPSGLGKIRFFREAVYPDNSFYFMETLAAFGLMLFLFLVGVKTDMSIILKSKRKAILIGICNFLIPLALNETLAFLLLRYVAMEPPLRRSLTWVASFQCLSSFYVIVCALADLKLLNSELGSLAISTSTVTSLLSYAWVFILYSTSIYISDPGEKNILLLNGFSTVFLLGIILVVLRPLMFCMVRQAGKHKAVKEGCIFIIFVMVLGCSFVGETFGQHFLLGPMMLGLAVPEGPPLGAALVTKLDSFVSTILLPINFVIFCAHANFSMINMRTFGIVELLAAFGLFWKLMGTVLPSLYLEMSLNDSVSLALMMSVQGILDILVIGQSAMSKRIDMESYTIMLISVVAFNAIVTPIVKFIYKPSRKYLAYKKRRTIQHAKPDRELRMLACLYQEDRTLSLAKLLELSNPTSESPIFFYVVHLIELSGRSAPLFINHQLEQATSDTDESDHIVKFFRSYEQWLEDPGFVLVNTFTAISPYATMHDEVCALALEKKAAMVILPFHKFCTIGGAEESCNAIRSVNCKILRMAPCSVGVLIDRGNFGRSCNKMSLTTTSSAASCSIGVIFLGGEDDREALAYANRMAKNPNVRLTVVRLIEYSSKKYEVSHDMIRDFELINEFRISNAKNEGCAYREEVVSDSVEIVSVIRAMEKSVDLILVGRQQNGDPELLLGLTGWTEFPELGFVGDMLASSGSESKVSVLVVQQQPLVGGGDQIQKGDPFVVVDMIPSESAKVQLTQNQLV